MAKRTAVVDIGSNSVRMVIFEKTSRFAFHLLHEVKSRVRISEGAYENGGNLQEAAIERGLNALHDFLSIAKSYHVRKILCVATSAVRDAPNKNDFLRRAKQELELNIKVINGEREAYLGAIACANLLPRVDAVTIDIGGGSTECAYIQNGNVTKTYSLDLGTVRLKELFFDRGDIKGATEYIDAALASLPTCDCAHAIGIGGTFRALANNLLKRSGHPLRKLHGYRFNATPMQHYIDAIIAAEDDAALKKLGVKRERYDVIRPGALILSRMLRSLKTATLTSSGVGVREGVFLSDLLRNAKDRFPEHFNPSMRYLLDRYDSEPEQTRNIATVAKRLFDLTHQALGVAPGFRMELSIAAKLCKIGTTLHYYSHHQHSYYLAQTALEYGYTHEQIMLISTLVRFQKRKQPAKSHFEDYEPLLPDTRTLNYLSFLLSLSDALLSHHPQNIDFDLRFDGKTITVAPLKRPLYLANEAVNSLQRPRELRVAFL